MSAAISTHSAQMVVPSPAVSLHGLDSWQNVHDVGAMAGAEDARLTQPPQTCASFPAIIVVALTCAIPQNVHLMSVCVVLLSMVFSLVVV